MIPLNAEQYGGQNVIDVVCVTGFGTTWLPVITLGPHIRGLFCMDKVTIVLLMPYRKTHNLLQMENMRTLQDEDQAKTQPKTSCDITAQAASAIPVSSYIQNSRLNTG